MMPYKETSLGKNQYIREFNSTVDSHELEWHLDKEDRLVEVMEQYRDWETDRKSTRLNSSHSAKSRMPSSA